MAYFKKVPSTGHEGKIVYGNGIVNGIVLLALSEVDDVEVLDTETENKKKSCVKVVFENDGVHVDVDVKIHYLQCVSDMAFKVQEAIRHNVEAMTEYHIASVNVNVKGVMFEELAALNN